MPVYEITTVDGRPEMWVVYPEGGGWVCAMPDNHPEGIGICGMPVESEPCSIHFPDGVQ